jgi:glutathione S-transferase
VRACVAAAVGLAGRELDERFMAVILRPNSPMIVAMANASSTGALMADLTLYHASPSRSSIALWMLEELGEPYDVKVLKLSEGDNQKPGYLAINPMGKVPAIKHGDVVITEVAAICTYLADAFPDKKLNVPLGDPRRGPYLKWLFFGPGCIEPAVIDRAAPRKEPPRRAMLGYGDFDTTMNVVAKAVEQGPWLLGEQFTAADVVIGANIRWGMMFKLIPERAAFVDYAARIAARPAAKRAEARDKEFGAE